VGNGAKTIAAVGQKVSSAVAHAFAEAPKLTFFVCGAADAWANPQQQRIS